MLRRHVPWITGRYGLLLPGRMPLVDAGRNAMLTGGLGNAIGYIAAHTDIPNSSGSNEVTGGSYARQAVTWASASAGVRDNSGALSIPIPAGTTVVGLSGWSALTTGTYYGWTPLGSTKKGFGTAANSGDVITSYGHGLSNTNRVIVTPVNNESLPTGYSASTLYYVVGATTDTFQLSLTSGGAAVTISTDGELFFQDCIPEVFASAGTLSVAIGAYDLDASLL